MHEDEHGLTLVEMMVAIMVIGVVMMAMASVLVTAMQSMRGSERVTHATQLGNEVLEELLTLPFDRLVLFEDDAEAHYGESLTFEGHPLAVIAHELETTPLPERQITRAGIDYDVEVAIVWDDGDLEDDEDQLDYKRVIVQLTWEHRGQQRTARTEAMRTADPVSQAVTARVEVHHDELTYVPLQPDGKHDENFTVIVEAEEAQSAVTLSYTNRAGGTESRTLNAVEGTGKREWRRNFNSKTREFANGGTLFNITATSEESEQVSTTMARALFLHPLDIREADLVLTPEPLRRVDGEFCEPLNLESEVIGAVASDPLNLHFLNEDAEKLDRQGEPLEDPEFEGEEPQGFAIESEGATLSGALYTREFSIEELGRFPVVGSHLRFELSMWRSAGLVEEPHELPASIEVEEVDSCIEVE